MRLAVLIAIATGCGFHPTTEAEGCTPEPELCNGVDDDCDGMIDEDFAVGAACDGSDADACMDGHVVCSEDGTTTVCDDDAASIVESCSNGVDDDCNGLVDCQDNACCTDAACTAGPYCCTGTGLVQTIPNNCITDFGSTGPGDSLEVYCCDGIARFCLSNETCPWRAGCGAPTAATCSRGGLASDAMATATCQEWRSQTTYNCSPTEHEYFP